MGKQLGLNGVVSSPARAARRADLIVATTASLLLAGGCTCARRSADDKTDGAKGRASQRCPRLQGSQRVLDSSAKPVQVAK
jgi:hypothetical protein